jgi:hypothetical protein
MPGSSCVAAQMAASQEGLSSMELVQKGFGRRRLYPIYHAGSEDNNKISSDRDLNQRAPQYDTGLQLLEYSVCSCRLLTLGPSLDVTNHILIMQTHTWGRDSLA